MNTDPLTQLSNMARHQAELEHQITLAEHRLTLLKQEHTLVSEKHIPELMEQVGMDSFRTNDGLTIQVASTVRASLPKARQEEAVRWLDEHGFAGLVKRRFEILFAKDEEAWAAEFEADLARRPRPLNVRREAYVHPQTLSAFVREQLEAGAELPQELFGVYHQRAAKVKFASAA